MSSSHFAQRRRLTQSLALTLAAGASPALLSACGGGSNDETSSGGSVPTASATYVVTFQSQWDGNAFPTGFPGASAHFSPLVGGVHNSAVSFWTPGSAASAGIKAMAERGETGALATEVNASVGSGQAASALIGQGLGGAGSQTTLTFNVSPAHPLVTLVSMIAPSSDWFVGVSGLVLYRDGQWLSSLAIPLKAYDAGTAPAGERIALLSTPADITDFNEGVHRTSGQHIAAMIFQRAA